MSKTIEVSELEFLFNLLIEKLKKEEVSTIKINMDYYRFISADEWDSLDVNIETGSLFDDIDCLKMLISDKERPLSYVDFDRLASLLSAISEIRNSVK